MSDFQTLQNEVLSHQLSDAKYRPLTKVWLNEGQRYVFLQSDLRTEMETEDYATTPGTSTLTLPDDFARVISLRDTDFADALAPIELRDFDDAGPASGRPTSYVVTGATVNLYPTPDAAYTLSLRYYKLPATMVDDTDEPELPEHYQHLLVRYALIRCFQRENDYQAASYWREEFNNDLMKLRGEAQYDLHDGPTQVPGTYEEPTVPLNWY